ncbi:hypothetical protein BJ973_005437 [Actinoplanes tereljensis]|uniref:Uncharacterized protein n=1 Tax=Paractinoplanes tereljensis TaxID=571912 RepID=A0A919TU86_9ACTN|nr:hypothetical protein Ate02nite_38400 [Actinoplanes tereljensis]
MAGSPTRPYSPLIRPTSLSIRSFSPPVALHAFPARHRDLHHHRVADLDPAVPQQLAVRREAVLDALGVVEPVDAEQHFLVLPEIVPQLPGLVDHVRPGVQRLHLGDVDRHRERAGAHHPAVEQDRVVGALRVEQLAGQLGHVVRGLRTLEADQIGAEHPAQQLDPAGELHEQLGRRERHVHEEADQQVGAQLAEHLRHQLQVVVLDPDGRAGLGHLGGGLGEPAVDRAVGLPPAAIEDRLLDGVVVERPERRVGEALVVAAQLVLGQRDRAQPQRADVGERGRRADPAAPAHPGGGGAFEDRVQGAGEPARTAPPLAGPIGSDIVIERETVGDHDQRALAHHRRLPEPVTVLHRQWSI